MDTTIQKYDAIFDPGSEIDYGRNWGDSSDGDAGWLQEGETIVTSSWEISADKEKLPTLVESTQGHGIDATSKITFIFLTGGTEGIQYRLTNKITTLTATGFSRTEKRTGIIYCCRK